MILEPSISVSPHHCKEAWVAAEKYCQRFQECTENEASATTAPQTQPQEMSILTWDDVEVNSLLGVGAFSDVYEVRVNNACFDASQLNHWNYCIDYSG